MDKHYGWQEGRGSQVPPGRAQNGQRWNERYRDDDRGMRSTRGGEFGGGWEQDDRRWTPSGGNHDREEYRNEGEQYGGQRGTFGPRGQQWTQSSSDQGRGYAGGDSSSQSFSGQGYGDQGYGSRSYGNQSSIGQGSRGEYGQAYAGRGFSGRGPKGYQRSDERIKEQLCERLTDDDNIDAGEITIEVKNGEATLTGTVGSREEKRAAEELAERSPGVREVQNHLRVTQERSSSQSGQFAQSGQSGRTSASGQSKARNDRE